VLEEKRSVRPPLARLGRPAQKRDPNMRQLTALLLSLMLNTACGGGGGIEGTGGTPGTGGGLGAGGDSSGGTSSGGAPGGGGTGTGGAGTGATSTGGTSTGGGSTGGSGGGGTGGSPGALEWLPSWATTIQRTETDNKPAVALEGNTLRQFVFPTVSGSQIRLQLSNERGNVAIPIDKVHIAKAKTAGDPYNSMGVIDATTDVALTFGGNANVTIPVGETVWSDPVDFPLTEIQLTAITMLVGDGVTQSGVDLTGHPGARTTTYVAEGDVVSEESLTDVDNRPRWYFINAIEVMAPADAFAIALLGDSITDGYMTENDFSRWSDFLTLELKKDPVLATKRSVLNFGMGANTLLGSVGGDQDPGVVRFQRDVLPRDKIKWLIVLEGVNDVTGATATAEDIMAGYDEIITAAEAQGIEVFISPLTPMNANASAGERPPLNALIRTLPNYDVGADLDLAIRDPADENLTLPAYKNDDLHPNHAGYQAMGEYVDLMLFYP
jgi:lysophospholipase L1-like esterase